MKSPNLLVGILFGALLCVASRPAIAQNSSLLHAPMPRVSLSGPQFDNPMNAGPLANPRPEQRVAEQALPQPSDGQVAPYKPGMVVQAGDSNADRPPVLLNGVSWTYQPAPPIRTFQKNDVVTIRVDEITRVQADGSAQIRKTTLYEAVLSDWIKLTDFRLRPDPQGNGDPTIGTESNNNFRAQSTVQSRESLTFNIAATVVDIRPNGNLVLEARKQIRVNDNLWETSLTGMCRAVDIAPDNVVLSKDLIDLEIQKEDRGHLRDGYKRGWFQRIWDRVQPF
ncbi:Flagellar L-ring protein precursor [Rubripirellula amarantea]|uniref:Flagellar L-ring protein n=2 Tax=Rubripirellula amarantea TaxID=2527999 RepID=A0A5C5WKM9_9BACT|nr:flagellar basal body L-ring protein FlgH [Rubripirellula amarantea]TWT50523.1 Flagellar L-ring protein precursor [Rubripirellula amarantea]